MQVIEQGPEKPAVQGVTEPTPEAKPDEMSNKFAILARKEKQLRAQAQAQKARDDAFKAQEEEYKTKYIPKDRLAKETLAVLAEQGITYDQLTNMILNGPAQPDSHVSKLEAKIAELESRLTKQVTTQEDNQKKSYDQAVNQIRNEAKLLVDSDAEYEMIKDTGSVEAVVELIEETYKADQVIMSVKDAAKQVEEYLVEEAMKMASLNKVKAKLSPLEEDKKPLIKSEPQLKTLTNAVSASSNKPMSNKDRRERAIAAFKGQLK